MKKTIIYLLLFLFAFALLVFYNQYQFEKRKRQAQPVVFSISLTDPPAKAELNQPVNFNWNVLAPDNFYTTSTTIYYSFESSSSALTKFDSPEAARYAFATPDYQIGRFKLPDTFDLNLVFDRPALVFYRAYAYIGGDHIWSPEYQLEIK